MKGYGAKGALKYMFLRVAWRHYLLSRGSLSSCLCFSVAFVEFSLGLGALFVCDGYLGTLEQALRFSASGDRG